MGGIIVSHLHLHCQEGNAVRAVGEDHEQDGPLKLLRGDSSWRACVLQECGR